MPLSVAERIAQVAEHVADHDVHGYSQPNRKGDGTRDSATLSDGSKVSFHGGDVDCSEMDRVCVDCALSGNDNGPITFMWTGNADGELRANGFVRMPYSASEVQRGDILWVHGHMGVALGGGKQADAHGDEYGGLSGPTGGDQTGHEVEVRNLRSWTYIYRYAGNESWLKTVPEKKRRRPMDCLIAIKDANTVVWYDGSAINDLTHPDDIAVARKVYRASVGQDMPEVELTQEEFARFCQSVRGGYPKHLRKLVEKYPTRSPEETV